jgi:hypothetical protein
VRQKQEPLAEKVSVLLVAQTRAAQAGKPSSAAEQGSEQAKVQAQLQRAEKPAACMTNVPDVHAPKRGKRGKELQSHVTAHDSANKQTAPGVIQGANGHALVEGNDHAIRPADVCGNGQE